MRLPALRLPRGSALIKGERTAPGPIPAHTLAGALHVSRSQVGPLGMDAR